jgi:hypothetical protein
MRAPIILIRATDLAQLTNEELRPAKHYCVAPIPAANPTGSLASGRDGAVSDPFHSTIIA